ncbi:hypothetical protein BCR42DRAFT_472968 [Absidia repens]|uniref:Uncharacterized protein n=1 Tax=Absidia repens TaxID=90262 RepID=A0A1X2ITL4_9FUNG|nr:hypothetical protein BCR42DRAFT_472968 [Absidia repens]
MQRSTRTRQDYDDENVTGSENATRSNTKGRSNDSEPKQQLYEKNVNRIMTRQQSAKLNEKGNQSVLMEMKRGPRAQGSTTIELKGPSSRTPNFKAVSSNSPNLTATELKERAEEEAIFSKQSSSMTPIHESAMIKHADNQLYSQNSTFPSSQVKETIEANQECFNAYDSISPFALDVFDSAFCLDAYDTSALTAKFQEEQFYYSQFPMTNSPEHVSVDNGMNEQDYGDDIIDINSDLLKNIYSVDEQETFLAELSPLFETQSTPAMQSSQ